MAGSYRLEWNGDEVAAAGRRGAVRGLGNAGGHLLAEAQREVPFREGILSDSGRVDVDEGALTVGVSFDTPYAEIQHEAEEFNHPNGRKAKYLSDPMEREQAVMAALLAAAIRAEVGGAGGGRRRR